MRGLTGLAGLLAGLALLAPGTAVAGDLPGGTWGTAIGLSMPGGVNGSIQNVSCASPGNCAAVGTYETGEISHAFVLTETDGTWGPVRAVSGISTDLSSSGTASVYCTAVGDCVAAWSADEHAYLIRESSGTWGEAQPVTLGTASTSLTGVTCTATGDCTAVGVYLETSAGHDMPFVIDSSDGTWGTPQPVAGVAALTTTTLTSATLSSVSCSSAGNCVAGGYYRISSYGGEPFVVTETDGSWGAAELVPGVSALDADHRGSLVSLSCQSSGGCVATGLYADAKAHYFSWVATESSGTWDTAQQLPAPATDSLSTRSAALSCSAQGYCVIGGSYETNTLTGYEAFVDTYSDGTWTAQALSGTTAAASGVLAVSCDATGDCTVGGYSYLPGSGTYRAFVAGEVNGAWGIAHALSGLSANSSTSAVTSLSCAAAGYCTATGYLGGGGVFVASEATAATVTLTTSASALTYGDEQKEPLTATVTSPTGGTPAGTVTITDGSSAACTTTLADGTGSCALSADALPAGGDELTAVYRGDASYAAASTTAAVTVTAATTRTTVTISAATVTYGTRYNAYISVAVAPEFTGTPAGDVTIYLNGKSLGTLGLADGTISGLNVPDGLSAGRYAITAKYAGDSDFAVSTSAASYLTVAKERTTTRLTLSRASVTYGHENTETLTATVAPSRATGKVTVKAGATTVCAITLKSGKGSCTLRTTQLKSGTYHLTASYPGDSNNLRSGSASVSLKVVA